MNVVVFSIQYISYMHQYLKYSQGKMTGNCRFFTITINSGAQNMKLLNVRLLFIGHY